MILLIGLFTTQVKGSRPLWKWLYTLFHTPNIYRRNNKNNKYSSGYVQFLFLHFFLLSGYKSSVSFSYLFNLNVADKTCNARTYFTLFASLIWIICRIPKTKWHLFRLNLTSLSFLSFVIRLLIADLVLLSMTIHLYLDKTIPRNLVHLDEVPRGDRQAKTSYHHTGVPMSMHWLNIAK